LTFVDDDEGQEDEGPLFAWLPPEDRLWRHPSEMAGQLSAVASGRPTGPTGHIWTVAMAAGVVGALVASAVLIAIGTMHDKPVKEVEKVRVASPVTAASASKSAVDASMSWSAVASTLAPSVVAVSTTLGAAQGEVGSGVVIGEGDRNEVFIVTAEDLLVGGSVTVTFDDRQPQVAKKVGNDPETGLAVVEVKTSDPDLASEARLASLRLAQPVLTIGARQANATSYVPGVINGLDSSVTNQSDSTMVGMLQVSGGPLPANLDGAPVVNQGGGVVGIYTAAASGGSANSSTIYAVPSDLVWTVADQIMADQKPTHAWIGVGSATDVTATSGQDRGSSVGVKIGLVCPNSPASASSLAAGDVVTSLDKTPISTTGELMSYLLDTSIGQTVRIGYHAPEGQTAYVRVKVANEPGSISC
jgi:putative serine protease PepD